MELEILKIYIENNLVNSFISPSKSSARVPIFFDKKQNGSLWLYINYQGLNNLTIKNHYPLPLVKELLDWLGRVQRFTLLDLTNIYH